MEVLLLLGVVVGGLWLASQSKGAPPILHAGELQKGDVPAPSEEKFRSSIKAGRRLRYNNHASLQSSGTIKDLANAIAQSGSFTVRSYGESKDTSSYSGGKFFWVELTARANFDDGFRMIELLASIARSSGYTLDRGSGGYLLQ